MAVSSMTSAKSGKSNTTKASPAELLEFLQQSALNLQHVGVGLKVGEVQGKVVIVIDGVRYCPGCKSLRFFEDMAGETCARCAVNKE